MTEGRRTPAITGAYVWFGDVFGFGLVSGDGGTGLTWEKRDVTVSQGETDVTSDETGPTIVSVRYQTELLTKRRAVDFCRVATALCRAA
jgi:hypothetical protein